MKKMLSIIVLIVLFWCSNNESNNKVKNIWEEPKINIENKINDEYTWENINKQFDKIKKLYAEKKYNEVKIMIDELVKTEWQSEWLKNFLKNTDIWKWYMEWDIWKDYIQEDFKKIQILYDAKKYNEVKIKIDELVKTRWQSEWMKDFLKNTDIWKKYSEDQLLN